MTLTEIKEEIPLMTLADRLKLARWLIDDATDNDEAWDAQIDEDCKPGGKLAKLRDEAIAEDERGETEEWP
jgi:hypothetical protein